MPIQSSIVMGIVAGPEGKGLLAVEPPFTEQQRSRFFKLLGMDFKTVLDYMPSPANVQGSSEFEVTGFTGISTALALRYAAQSAHSALEMDGNDVSIYGPILVDHDSDVIRQYLGEPFSNDDSTVHRTEAVAY